jgi:hypothetical protein
MSKSSNEGQVDEKVQVGQSVWHAFFSPSDSQNGETFEVFTSRGKAQKCLQDRLELAVHKYELDQNALPRGACKVLWRKDIAELRRMIDGLDYHIIAAEAQVIFEELGMKWSVKMLRVK